MKSQINQNKFFFSGLRLYKSIFEAGSLVSLSNLKHLKLVVQKIGDRITTLSMLSTKVTNRIRGLIKFYNYIVKINKHHGSAFTIKYLKVCQLAVQKYISGSPFKSLREIEPDMPMPRLTRSGLPIFISRSDRILIGANNLKIIRLYLSLLSIYRVLEGPYKAKLETITQAFSGDKLHLESFNK